MPEPAGERYEVEVKSGGWLGSRFFGGGELGAWRNRWRLGGSLPATPDDEDDEIRDEALREGEVEIKDTTTGKVVWKYHPDNLPEGMDESKFVDELDEDLESCSVEEFQQRWRIAPDS